MTQTGTAADTVTTVVVPPPNGTRDTTRPRHQGFQIPAPITAPCGCTFRVRFVSAENCTVVDREAWTGHRISLHMRAARKHAR